jgi:hypothetical protein
VELEQEKGSGDMGSVQEMETLGEREYNKGVDAKRFVDSENLTEGDPKEMICEDSSGDQELESSWLINKGDAGHGSLGLILLKNPQNSPMGQRLSNTRAMVGGDQDEIMGDLSLLKAGGSMTNPAINLDAGKGNKDDMDTSTTKLNELLEDDKGYWIPGTAADMGISPDQDNIHVGGNLKEYTAKDGGLRPCSQVTDTQGVDLEERIVTELDSMSKGDSDNQEEDLSTSLEGWVQVPGSKKKGKKESLATNQTEPKAKGTGVEQLRKWQPGVSSRRIWKFEVKLTTTHLLF